MGSIIPPFYASFMAAGSQDLLDVYDLITEGLMMPIGAIAMCIIIGWKTGFKWVADEVEENGNKFYAKGFFEICIKYVTPVVMVFVLVALILSYVNV